MPKNKSREQSPLLATPKIPPIATSYKLGLDYKENRRKIQLWGSLFFLLFLRHLLFEPNTLLPPSIPSVWAFRGSGLRLHCSTSFRNGCAAPPIPRRLLWPTALQTAGICLFLLYYGIISANKESFR